ncbi:PLP-dependent aminotransferase family protein [Chitinophaga qingshengii]|uniref:PLP-dependent aminotransferase family protein n=1 Tax=Chitinophaga qingshengii TaxID=1569794 RepID=A0ABR7TUE4_9BACT|nr:PLP-dependent aminotransferase family protein [Chitinophaga qingshengii]
MKTYRHEIFTRDIEKNIREGIWQPGYKLPSVRALKEKYGASVSTIQRGYEDLLMRGLVKNLPRSGYFVARQQVTEKPAKAVRQPVVRDAVFQHGLSATTAQPGNRLQLSAFHVAAPGDLMIPQKLLLRTLQQVVRSEGAGLLRYYPASGSPALKEQIIQRAAGYGTLFQAAELLITDGALQALYIALSAACMPGDVVAVESPSVFSVLQVISVLQLRVVEIPVGRDGYDVDVLHKVCTRTRIKAIIVTPNFHNPTGTCLSVDQQQALLAIAQRHDIALIENDIYGDLHFSGSRPPTIKALDDSGLVMTFSSYAKTLAPGIRLGWLSAGRYLSRAEQVRFALGSSVSPVFQETVTRLLQTHSYDRHLRSFRTQLAKNAWLTLNLVSCAFPEGTSLTMPAGGYHCWIQLPSRTDMDAFYKACEQIGVRFTPGSVFSFSDTFRYCFRLVFADTYTAARKRAIKKAGAALQ